MAQPEQLTNQIKLTRPHYGAKFYVHNQIEIILLHRCDGYPAICYCHDFLDDILIYEIITFLISFQKQ